MKLLEKSAIISQQNTEKKAAIDSGVFIAEKVDALRKDFAAIKEQRDNFIKGSQEALTKAISELKSEKGNLEVAITEQKKVLAKLREPLDEEWKKVNIKTQIIDSLRKQEDILIANLVSERNVVENNRLKTVKFLDEARKNKEITDENVKIAKENRTQTHLLLEEAKYLKETRESELFVKELELSAREKALKIKESQYKKDIEALRKEQKALEAKKKRWTTSA